MHCRLVRRTRLPAESSCIKHSLHTLREFAGFGIPCVFLITVEPVSYFLVRFFSGGHQKSRSFGLSTIAKCLTGQLNTYAMTSDGCPLQGSPWKCIRLLLVIDRTPPCHSRPLDVDNESTTPLPLIAHRHRFRPAL